MVFALVVLIIIIQYEKKPKMIEDKLRLGVLISGGGSTAEAVIMACQEGRLSRVEPVVVISSRPEAPGIQKARDLGIETLVVQPRRSASPKAFGEELLIILKTANVDLVSQNGWLPKTPDSIVEEYEGRIINQHPGPLDPGRVDFGGWRMYGARVTCARLAHQWITGEENPWTESTIHHVVDEYDQGDLIRVLRMEMTSHFRLETINELGQNPQYLVETTRRVQTQLLPLEHENVIAVLHSFTEGQVPKFERSMPLVPKNDEFIVNQAKELAIQLFPKG